MHDWTLISVLFEWANARVTMILRNNNSETVSVIAENVTDLSIPKLDEWGRSVSVNQVIGPIHDPDGALTLSVEMQSGDVLTITAKSFDLPS